MRYRFTVNELEKLKIFLAETVEYLQKIADQALRLKVTSDTAQSKLIIDSIVDYLHNLKGQAAFFGLMEMVMLIRQTQSMLEAMGCGRLQIDAGIVDVLLDTKNILGEMTRELSVASAKFDTSEELDIELACAQEAECLSDFIGKLLQRKLSTALVLVPKRLVSKLPAVIQIPLRKQKVEEENSDEECHGNNAPETVSTVNESVEIAISKSTAVSDEKIQQVLTIIRELTTTNSVFSQLASKLMMENNLPNLSREAKNIGKSVNRIATELEEAVMSMARVELALIFLQFPHIVNDIGSQTGKNICLVIEGGHITVDKAIVKHLSNLLLKIICTMARLSIEPPAERAAVSKEIQGNIWLTACSSGKYIVIEARDDGKSMKGADADAKVLEISDLMATMNEVYHQRDALPGNLEMTSPSGNGSKIKITLPPTILRCSGLLVEASGELFIVPIANVVEIVRVTMKQLVSKRGRQLLYHRGAVLGIVSLTEILGMRLQQTDSGIPVVVVTNGQDKIGLMVHKLHKEQEIVLRSLPDYLKNSEYIEGAAVTSDEKVALVLNVSALIKKVSSNNCHNSIRN